MALYIGKLTLIIRNVQQCNSITSAIAVPDSSDRNQSMLLKNSLSGETGTRAENIDFTVAPYSTIS
jgi:hypothetical protein